MQSKVDLHVHSKFSNRPSEWFLRRVGAPESFAEPADVYDRALEAGMDFVTISDHNCIDGALEIADRPGTFLSSEITTYFPENGCKIHCLVCGMTEEQFRDIQKVRENIYDFRDYLLDEGILHSVTHPLYSVNGLLTVEHVERLLVLFNRFEAINGMREPSAANLVNVVFRNLTPELVGELADKHGVDPIGHEPWKKCFTAGSDDHSGMHVGTAFTVTPKTQTAAGFLRHLRSGNHEMGGESGTSLKLAYSFYVIAYEYYKNRFLRNDSGKPNLIANVLKKLAERGAQSGVVKSSPVRTMVTRVVIPWKKRKLNDVERMLVDEFTALFQRDPNFLTATPGVSRDRRSFEIASHIGQQLAYSFMRKFFQDVEKGSLIESLQTFVSLFPVALGITPYFAAFANQHKDRRMLREVAQRFQAHGGLAHEAERRVWVTDTFHRGIGVARKIEALGRVAQEENREFSVITCLREAPEFKHGLLRNFNPVGAFRFPSRDGMRMAFPPFLEVIEYFEDQQFSEVIVATPGPLGLAAVAAARLLGIRVAGVYHTDFPHYVYEMTQDDSLAEVGQKYISWFFGMMDRVLVPSQWYYRELQDNGCPEDRIELLPWGVDSTFFHARQADPEFWRRYPCGTDFKFITVGHISRDKNIETLIRAFQHVRDQGCEADLVIVGDGPLVPELRRRYANQEGLVFTGALQDEDLAAAYAGADVFVYPSTSATFGNVVLEAQASGLPVIVADRGGPQDIVRPARSGLIVEVEADGKLAAAMECLYHDERLRLELAARGRAHAATCTWNEVLDRLCHPFATPRPAPRQMSTATDALPAESILQTFSPHSPSAQQDPA